MGLFFSNGNPEAKVHAGTGKQVEVRVPARVLVLRPSVCALFSSLSCQDSLNPLGTATENCGLSLTTFILSSRLSNSECSPNKSTYTLEL